MKRTLKQLKSSYDHWKNDYKKLKLFGGKEGVFFKVFSGSLCGICKRTYHSIHCGTCPLPSKAELSLADGYTDACSVVIAPWLKARKAHTDSDKKSFMKQRARIMKRLARRIKKLGGEV